MNQIEPPDIFYLSAAVGWLELGNKNEARDELHKISAEVRHHPDVLELEWTLASDAKDWEGCVEIGEVMVQTTPERAFGWVHRSYALHELGRTQEAWDALIPAAPRFPKEFLVPYNLACYAARLDNLDDARFWLSKAIIIAGLPKIKAMALQDSDLQPLWSEIEPMG